MRVSYPTENFMSLRERIKPDYDYEHAHEHENKRRHHG